MAALVCGCHTERNRGGADTENFSDLPNNHGGSMQTNLSGPDNPVMVNTNPAPSHP